MVIVILALVWLVVLGSGLLRRRDERTPGGVDSISHFHHQLRVLEHAGPKIVSPAYRLRTADGRPVEPERDAAGGHRRPALSVVGADRLPRPALAFLGNDPPEGATGVVVATPVAGGVEAPAHRGPDPYLRARARRRRRDTLGVLALTFVGTLLLGIIPGLAAVWVLTALSGVALVGYVTLLVQLQARAEERERKLRYLRPEPGLGSSSAGHPVAVRGATLGDAEEGDVGIGYEGVAPQELARARRSHPTARVAVAR